MDHHAHFAEVVFGLGAPRGDPGGLAQTDFASDHQGVGWVLTVAVCVVVLQRLEVTVGVKGVEPGEELWTGPNLTSTERTRGFNLIIIVQQLQSPTSVRAISLSEQNQMFKRIF